MFDFTLIAKNCDEVGNKAAAESRRLGLPTVGWDNEKQQIVKTWPDGRKEILEPYKASQVQTKNV